MSGNETITLEYREKTAVVTIDRPGRRNAFNERMFARLAEVAGELAARLPRAIVVTGAGDQAFSAGFDVRPDNPMVERMFEAITKGKPEPARELIAAIRVAVDGFVALPVPIIAALNGLAYGGGAELAVRCDLRIADPSAVICFSEARLGLIPDWGGGSALAKLVGPSRAADLALTAREVGASEALAMGLVSRMSAPGHALDEALEMAATIAGNGPRAVRSALAVIRESRNEGYAASLEREAALAAELLSSGECVHGVGAFLEKKKPDFPDID